MILGLCHSKLTGQVAATWALARPAEGLRQRVGGDVLQQLRLEVGPEDGYPSDGGLC